MTVPIQKFQIGARVRLRTRGNPFVLGVIYIGYDKNIWYGPGLGSSVFLACELTLASERPPYVPSERLVVGRRVTIARYQPELYRCETDDELVARHAVERAEYDQQDATDAVIYNASGQPIGITGRTGQPGPGADNRQVCDYPICSTRGAGHPLACKCRTATPKAAP